MSEYNTYLNNYYQDCSNLFIKSDSPYKKVIIRPKYDAKDKGPLKRV